jgi:hypothetical protein
MDVLGQDVLVSIIDTVAWEYVERQWQDRLKKERSRKEGKFGRPTHRKTAPMKTSPPTFGSAAGRTYMECGLTGRIQKGRLAQLVRAPALQVVQKTEFLVFSHS